MLIFLFLALFLFHIRIIYIKKPLQLEGVSLYVTIVTEFTLNYFSLQK